jgi:hypothetical protein
MFWNKFFNKKKTINYQFYETLEELPLWNWIKIYQEKDFTYILKDVDYRIFVIDTEIIKLIEPIWKNIYDEYLNDFGFTKKYKRVLELERKISLLKCKMWIDDNKFIQNEIRIKEKQLLKEKNNNSIDENGNDFTKQVVLIEKWLNSSLDIYNLSTRKYFTYLNIINDEAENIKMKQAKENVKN